MAKLTQKQIAEINVKVEECKDFWSEYGGESIEVLILREKLLSLMRNDTFSLKEYVLIDKLLISLVKETDLII